MECPHCHSGKVRKYGVIKGKQRYYCQDCGRYFQSSYEQQGYSSDVRQICLKMYLNGMGFRGIERVTGIGRKYQIKTLPGSTTSSYFMPLKINSNAEIFSSAFNALFEIQTSSSSFLINN